MATDSSPYIPASLLYTPGQPASVVKGQSKGAEDRKKQELKGADVKQQPVQFQTEGGGTITTTSPRFVEQAQLQGLSGRVVQGQAASYVQYQVGTRKEYIRPGQEDQSQFYREVVRPRIEEQARQEAIANANVSLIYSPGLPAQAPKNYSQAPIKGQFSPQQYFTPALKGQLQEAEAYGKLTGPQKGVLTFVTLTGPESYDYIGRFLFGQSTEPVIRRQFKSLVKEKEHRGFTPFGAAIQGVTRFPQSAVFEVESSLVAASAGTRILAAASKNPVVAEVVKRGFQVGTGFFVGGRGLEVAKTAKENPAKALGLSVVTGASLLFGGISGIVEKKFLTRGSVFKAAEEKGIEQFKPLFDVTKQEVPIQTEKVSFSGAQRIPEPARPVIRQYLTETKDVLGGSIGARTQVELGAGRYAESDLDIYTKANPVSRATELEARLKAAGVERVSRVDSKVTIGGAKVAEFKEYSQFVYNVESVGSPLRPVRSYVRTTPEGIRVPAIEIQARRKLVGALIDQREKDLPDFVEIASRITSGKFNVQERVAGLAKSARPMIERQGSVQLTEKAPAFGQRSFKEPDYDFYPQRTGYYPTAGYSKAAPYKPFAGYKTTIKPSAYATAPSITRTILGPPKRPEGTRTSYGGYTGLSPAPPAKPIGSTYSSGGGYAATGLLTTYAPASGRRPQVSFGIDDRKKRQAFQVPPKGKRVKRFRLIARPDLLNLEISDRELLAAGKGLASRTLPQTKSILREYERELEKSQGASFFFRTREQRGKRALVKKRVL